MTKSDLTDIRKRLKPYMDEAEIERTLMFYEMMTNPQLRLVQKIRAKKPLDAIKNQLDQSINQFIKDKQNEKQA